MELGFCCRPIREEYFANTVRRTQPANSDTRCIAPTPLSQSAAHRNPYPTPAVATYGTYGTDLEQLVRKNSRCELGAQRGKSSPRCISTNFYKRYGRYRRCRQGLRRRGFLVDTSSVKV